MADPKFPYVRWRSGRPRSQHSQWQRKRGFSDEDLKNPDGSWFTLQQAHDWSDQHVKEIAASRSDSATKIRARAKEQGRKVRDTVADLLDDWKAAWPDTMSAASKTSYVKGINAILFKPETPEQRKARRELERQGKPTTRKPEEIAGTLVAAIGKPELRAFHTYAMKARGKHMALGMIATLSAAMTWATESPKWRLKSNPRLDMEFERPPGRIVQVFMPEFAALVAAADALGKPSIGDCIYLGLFTGQRQTDRLRMKDEGNEGRFTFRQSKTGELIDIKEAPQLTTRLAQARARVAAITLRLGLKDRPAQIVVNEENGQPYADKTYGNWFLKVRALAIKGSNEHGLAPCPSLAFINADGEPDTKHDQDLRDTCVMLLDRAGCDLLTICDITGHSYASAQTIVRHYRARNADRADSGIDRLVLQVRKEGMTG